LNVEAGAYWPAMARLISGVPAEGSVSDLYCFCVIPLTQMLGL